MDRGTNRGGRGSRLAKEEGMGSMRDERENAIQTASPR